MTMDKNLSESNSELKVSVIAIETNTEHYGTDYEYSQTYGYKVFDRHPLAQLKENGLTADLYLGSHIVSNYDVNMFDAQIPIWYCVRTPDKDGYKTFVCGLDLMKDGRVWVGIGHDSYFNTIEDAMNYVEQAIGKPCIIVTEEQMLL